MRHSLWAHPVAALTPFVLGATVLPDAARAEVTCSSCRKGLVRGSVVQDRLISSIAYGFGSWETPIKIEATETGGCSVGCHRTLRYDRVKPVVH